MTRFFTQALSAAALLGAALLACNGDPPGADCGGCTLEFRYYTVTVVDGAGSAVDGVELSRVNLRTGRTLEPGWLGLLIPGTYVVADDGQLSHFSRIGDRLRVTGTKDGATFATEFVFAADSCGCHLVKVSGPDTVTIGN